MLKLSASISASQKPHRSSGIEALLCCVNQKMEQWFWIIHEDEDVWGCQSAVTTRRQDYSTFARPEKMRVRPLTNKSLKPEIPYSKKNCSTRSAERRD